MLKITRIDTPTEQRLILEGWLIEPWTAELTFQWEQMRRVHPERKFIVDLRSVTRIDRTGESALAGMKSEGAKFLVRGVWIKYLVKSLDSKGAGRKSQNGPALVVDPS